MELQIGKWGNSLALRLPAQVVKKMRLNEGASVELTVDDTGKATLAAAPAFDKAAYLERVRALTRSMPMTDSVVREMRDDARY
ncbi:MAG: AbrB/MazE/SpoVT family DNA-binding domain-containing protein [Variovorax sp.]